MRRPKTLPPVRAITRWIYVGTMIFSLAILCTGRASANPGRIDPSFVPTPAPKGSVRAILPLADGSVIIGGDFPGSGASPQAYLAKYREDGSLDTAFNPVLDGAVEVITASDFGGFYIGGAFTHVDGTPSGGIACLNDLGNLDTFRLAVGDGFDGTVYAISQSPSGFRVGGSFNSFRGSPAKNLATLNFSGTLDHDFDVNGPVKAIADYDLQDGTFVFGGSFTFAENQQRFNVGLANRFGVTSTSTLPPANGEVTDILAFDQPSNNQPPTPILVFSGSFTSMNGSSPGIAAFARRNGGLQKITFGTGGVSQVSAMSLDSEKRLVAGGTTGNLWRLDPLAVFSSGNAPWNASADFLPSSHTNGKITSVAQEGKFRYYIGGDFTVTDSQPSPYFVRLLRPLGNDTPAPPAINRLTITDDRIALELEPVPYTTGYGIQTSGDGGITWTDATESASSSVYVKGLRPEENYLARARSINTNGAGITGDAMAFRTSARRTSGPLAYTPLPGDWANGSFWVSDLLVDSSGRLGIIGPNDMRGNLLGAFAVLNSQLDPVFSYNATNNPRVDYAAADPRGGYIVKPSLRPLQRLDSNGSVDGSFTPAYDPSHNIRDMAVLSDGRVVIGGTMRVSEGAPNGALVRLEADGAIDTDFDPQFLDGSSSGQVERVIPASGDRLLVIGDFLSVDGIDLRDMALLTPAGEVDPLFRPDFEATRFQIFDDATMDSQGRILAAGLFHNKGDEGRTGVVRYLSDGSLDPDWDPPVFHSRPGNAISPDFIVAQPDDKVLVAGGFRTVNGVRGCSVVRLNQDGTLDETFDAGLGFRDTAGGMAVIQAIVLMPDSTVAVGGWFTTFDGEHREGFALLRGDGTPADYALWQTANQLPEGNDLGTDSDGDGLADGIEFAYDLDPKKPDSRNILTVSGSGIRITPPIRRGVEISAVFSETLDAWEAVPIKPDWTTAPPAGKGAIKGFFRIRIDP